MRYNQQQRDQISKDCKGRIIRSMEWVPPEGDMDGYWVMIFKDGSEISLRLMAEM
jgi:hypothetical protein